MRRLQVSEMSTKQTNVLEQGMLEQYQTQLSTTQKANMKNGFVLLCHGRQHLSAQYRSFVCQMTLNSVSS